MLKMYLNVLTLVNAYPQDNFVSMVTDSHVNQWQ